jgi:TRAP-type C4-dicarboxylate transport system substrate-binding protein
VHNRAAEVLGRGLVRRLGDGVDFALSGNIVADGHKAVDLLAMVESGEMTMCYFASSYLAERVAEFALLDLPFVIRDRDQAYGVLDGPLGARLGDGLRRATGFRALALWDNGFRHFSNRLRPIRQPADCAGMRIRTLFSALHGETFRRLGFQPVPLDVADMIEAVKNGDIDAQENPLTNIHNFGFHKFHRHITMSSHFFGVAVVLCHGPSYDGWPDEVRRAVAAAVAEATRAQRGLAAAADAEVLAALDGAENEIVALTDEERHLFVDAVAPVIDRQAARFDAALLDHLV